MKETSNRKLRDATDFGARQHPAALVNVTNVCNLECRDCFVYRKDNPNRARDKMDDATMLHQLRVLRDRHGIQLMLFMGGEPMIRKALVLEAMKLRIPTTPPGVPSPRDPPEIAA
jgi:MoaA/NifB/PqqE/SkfB family radical SAM enzyme